MKFRRAEAAACGLRRRKSEPRRAVRDSGATLVALFAALRLFRRRIAGRWELWLRNGVFTSNGQPMLVVSNDDRALYHIRTLVA